MRRNKVNLTADVSLLDLGRIGTKGVIQIGGTTFGSGTLTLFVSLDGGNTKNALKDASGTAYSTTANDTMVYDMKVDDFSGLDPQLFVTLSGSTNPVIGITIVDSINSQAPAAKVQVV